MFRCRRTNCKCPGAESASVRLQIEGKRIHLLLRGEGEENVEYIFHLPKMTPPVEVPRNPITVGKTLLHFCTLPPSYMFFKGGGIHEHQKNPGFGTDMASTNPTGADLGFRMVRVSTRSRILRAPCVRLCGGERDSEVERAARPRLKCHAPHGCGWKIQLFLNLWLQLQSAAGKTPISLLRIAAKHRRESAS